MAQTASASADKNWPQIKGKVVAVDIKNSIITINSAKKQQIKFQIVSTSEIKIKKYGLLKWDRDATLKDITIGQSVAVTYYDFRENKIVRDINITLDTTVMNVRPLMWLLMARAQAKLHRK